MYMYFRVLLWYLNNHKNTGEIDDRKPPAIGDITKQILNILHAAYDIIYFIDTYTRQQLGRYLPSNL